MPKIIIKRNSEWANKYRSFDLYLNGKKISEIKDKELLTFEIPEGKYILEAKIDWCGSKPVNLELAEDDLKRIEISGFVLSKYFLPLAIFTGLIYFGIYLKFHKNSLLLGALLMFIFGYLLFFLTFGRNQYLRLTEK